MWSATWTVFRPATKECWCWIKTPAVFRSGKTVLSLPYSDIHNVELGTKVMPPSDGPLYKVWQLPKRFLTERAMHQMVNFRVRR